MLATKNRGAGRVICLFGTVLLLAACSPTGPGALVAGKKRLEAGKVEAAIAELQTAVRLMPTNAMAWNYLGVAYHQAGQWTNARAAYSQAIRFNRDLLEVRFNLGCLQLEQNDSAAAAVELFAYTARRANDANGWTKLGLAQQQTRDLMAAENSFREALRCEAQNPEALNGLGLVLAQRNRPRDAADSFAAALKAEPKHRAALLNYATIQQQLNNPTEALKFYRTYLALQPRPQDWDAVNAIVRSLEPEPPAAIAVRPVVTNTFVAVPRSNAVPRPVAPIVVATRSNPPVAAKVETPVPANKPAATPTAVSAPPPPIGAEIKRVAEPVIKPVVDDSRVAVVRTENPAPAAATSAAPESKGFFAKLNPFKRDPKASPAPIKTSTPIAAGAITKPSAGTNADSYATLPAGKAKVGDRKAAESELARGQQEQRAKRLAEALQFYRRAVSLDESYFEAHYCLGLAAFEIRNFKLAATAWQNAIALRPDSGDARYNYALTLKADGRFSEAAEQLEKLLALHPDEARGHLTLGILYADKVRDIPRARQHYQRVLQLDPRNPQADAIRYWLVANPR
jgi:Flp pilus assembly protein TadD